jgi:DMSO/TMAO reductase YedYZ molybdopterin-dependent catalytic subunit
VRVTDRDNLPESPRERVRESRDGTSSRECDGAQHGEAGAGDVNVGARRLGRAAFIGVVGAGVATLFYGKAISGVTSRVTNPLSDATGLDRIVPSSGWRIYTVADSMPTFDPTTWRLRIGGLVRRPVELTYTDLLALPKAQQVSTFHCVTGWVVPNVHWGGVRFHDLLARAGPLPAARAVQFVSAEKPYDDYLDLRQTALRDVMLAYELDGRPLSQEHGAPARVVIPEMYGYKNVKWVEQITLLARAGSGYWEQRGYDVNAWVGRSNGYG